MNKNKIILIILTLCILLPLASSCAADEASQDSAAASSDSLESSEDKGGDDKYGTEIEVKNMNGRVFRVLCRDFSYGSTSIQGYNGEVIQREDFSENTAGTVDIEKNKVRKLIEERYNCKIEGTIMYAPTAADLNNVVINSIQAGLDDAYDMVFDAWGYSGSMVTQGYYIDMNTISTINFENPWWDQNARSDMSIMNKLFWMTGDINTYDNDGTWVMLYNKDLFKIHYPDLNIYDLVRDNEWTFDKLKELASPITADYNSDNLLDEKDVWGFATESYNIYVHLIGAGQRITKKDENDIPYFTHMDESSLNALEKIIEYYNEKNKVIVGDREPYTSKGFTNIWEETIIKAFAEGRALFFCCGLINLTGFRDLEFEYGILPIPMGSKTQDTYSHSVSKGNMSALTIPMLHSKPEDYNDLGLIIEALGAESKNLVTPVYYDKNLKTTDARSEDDEEMLDLIFDTRCFDMATAFYWGDILSDIMTMDTNITSKFQSSASKAQADLDETIRQLEEKFK